ncbi:MAG: NifB/NifX family molybdenum-iron cluster-binding protein [Negativicutes bacterium]|nr:NifB/NifX family molybdenum-iron cluster-binding protein [Negativicutes bacterium]
MAFRVAVASSDGKFINQHFGRAQAFLIYELNEGDSEGFRFVERRETKPPCSYQQHDDDLLTAAAALVSDCRTVLVSQIGPGAVQALAAHGVNALEAPAFIDEALAKLGKTIQRFPKLKING